MQAMSMMPSTPTPASISSTVSKCSENLYATHAQLSVEMGSAGRTVATPEKLAPNPESKALAHVELGSEAIRFMLSRLLPSPYPTMSTRAPSAFMSAIALNAAGGPPLCSARHRSRI